MSKKIRNDGSEIVITVPCVRLYSKGQTHEEGSELSARYAYSEAERIAKAIRRTLGNYETPCMSADWRMVSEPVCEYCGSKWTEASDQYNGGCCDRDQTAQDQRDMQTTEADAEVSL